MRLFGSLVNEGRAARRGVMTLFGVTGFLLVSRWKEYGPDYLSLALGLASLAVCIGLWINMLWARWLALGACFLAVVGAFAMPVILELWRPFENYEGGATKATLFSCVTAAAIGVIGYKGLGYFRSPAAWIAFSTDAQGQAALATESSAKVVVSAACIAVFLGMFAVARDVPGPRASVIPGSSAGLPDLVVNSLCVAGENLVRAEVQNRGKGTDTRSYKISFSDLRGRGGAQTSSGAVPSAGYSTWVALDNAVNQSEQDGVQQFVSVNVDSNLDIRESNENNNRKNFEIVYRYFHPGNLPACP